MTREEYEGLDCMLSDEDIAYENMIAEKARKAQAELRTYLNREDAL